MVAREVEALVTDVIRRQRLTGACVLVAVSGGPDSVALLLALSETCETLQLRLHAAHFDHALRPDSAADAVWVAQLAADLDVGLTTARAEIPPGCGRTSTRPTGSEAASREARYGFLGRTARDVGATAVLVGHTQDDQVETRLLHVVRGSGLHGLRGMSEASLMRVGADEPIRVIRPLLGATRKAIELYCVEHGIKPRIDPTNDDIEYSRNRIRHMVVPQLTQINPRFAEALDRLSRIASESEDFVDGALDRQLDGLAETSELGWRIERTRWRLLHRSLKRALLRRAANSLSPGADVGADAIEDAIFAADAWNAGTTMAWSDDRILSVEHDYFEIRRSSRPAPTPREVTLERRVPATVDFAVGGDRGWHLNMTGDWRPDARLVLRLTPRSDVCVGRDGDRWHSDLDQAAVGDKSRLSLRSRRAGDWLAPEGMVGQKKLQDLFVDAHVPVSVRDRVPLVATSGGVAWIIGVRRDRRFVARAGCSDVLCIEVTTDRVEQS